MRTPGTLFFWQQKKNDTAILGSFKGNWWCIQEGIENKQGIWKNGAAFAGSD